MELFIKLHPGQPSRIGIKYTYDYLAQKSYEEIIRKAGSECFSLTFEPVQDRLNLVLTAGQNGLKFTYKAVEYKPESLKKLRDLYSPGNPLQFVHIYPKNNVLMIAKPFKKEIFVNISGFELINV